MRVFQKIHDFMYESPESKIINSQSRIYFDLENMIYNILAQLYFEVTLHFLQLLTKDKDTFMTTVDNI